MKYGYLGAGQGAKYSRALQNLKIGSKVFAYMKGLGYVGYGEVVQAATPIRDFVPEGQKKPILKLPLKAPRPGLHAANRELSEWCVGVRWHKTFAREHAKTFKGVFANQNIVCKLRDPSTTRFLEKEFGITDGSK